MNTLRSSAAGMVHVLILAIAMSMAACSATPLSGDDAAVRTSEVASLDEITAGLASNAASGLMRGSQLEASSKSSAPSESRSRSGPDRKMVYDAQLGLRVARPDEAIARAIDLAKSNGGYLSRSDNTSVRLRVPAAAFETVLQGIRRLGSVLQESVTAQDVTDKYRDLAIRLENATKARERLLQLLEKAEKIADILAIEQQVQRLTNEIESMKGQLQALQDRIAMSTITARFQSAAPAGRAPRQPSRFPWINSIGADHVLRVF